MRKVIQSAKNITLFGGLNFIFKAIKDLELAPFIDKELGLRNIKAQYSYPDILFSLLGNSLCNGEYVSDLEHFKNNFKNQIFNKIPSPDTVEYACQELKTSTIIENTSQDIEHQYKPRDY